MSVSDSTISEDVPSGSEIDEWFPVGKNNFSKRELDWLMGHMDEFCAINGRRNAVDPETGEVVETENKTEDNKNETSVFKEKLLTEFGKRFPFRHPDNAQNEKYPQELRTQLGISSKNWGLPTANVSGAA